MNIRILSSLSLENTVLVGNQFMKRGRYSEAIVKVVVVAGFFFFFHYFHQFRQGGGGRACAVLALGEAAFEVIWRELSQHFWPGLQP